MNNNAKRPLITQANNPKAKGVRKGENNKERKIYIEERYEENV